MADAPRLPDAGVVRSAAKTALPWSGTGLCCEAQGDGVPCQGVDGECESCGRALPPAGTGQRRDAERVR